MAAPKGNHNAKKGAYMRQHLEWAMEKWSPGLSDEDLEKVVINGSAKKTIAARLMCMKQVDEAVKGDSFAYRDIFDRIDGKPKQAVVGGDEDDAPIRHAIAVSYVDPSDPAA